MGNDGDVDDVPSLAKRLMAIYIDNKASSEQHIPQLQNAIVAETQQTEELQKGIDGLKEELSRVIAEKDALVNIFSLSLSLSHSRSLTH